MQEYKNSEVEPLEFQFPFWKSLTLISLFIFLAPITILTSLYTLVRISDLPHATYSQTKALQSDNIGVHIYAALPVSVSEVSASVVEGDSRAIIIKNYLETYNSPLVGHEEYIVQMADRYGLDFRLITAIAQQESNLCKKIPPGTYNCWGWGIHSEGTLGFESYRDGIQTVSEGLRREYLNKGYETPEEIMSKYTPLSDGSWARGVSQFMAEMQ